MDTNAGRQERSSKHHRHRKYAYLGGPIISGLAALSRLCDGFMKLLKPAAVVKATRESDITGIGLLLLGMRPAVFVLSHINSRSNPADWISRWPRSRARFASKRVGSTCSSRLHSRAWYGQVWGCGTFAFEASYGRHDPRLGMKASRALIGPLVVC
jgi:hypothetical protein